MKILLTNLVFLIGVTLIAQTEKGAGVISKSAETTGTTRAVVVGISDYQDEGIPDLRFAHKDAAAFAEYLQSPAGGAVSDENILLLQNEKATNARIADALIWMLEESESGDQAVIYFSGHGDVETITRFNRGYLLTYDSPPKIYMAGAFNIRDLQDIISTLSEKEVRVVMISDACRAGKLAGSDVGGTEATAQNLSKQFANEIKILSCQPNEFSLEGEQWGGGRGAFSYHLLDGLQGLADKNGDASVNLFEIGRYLEDLVPEETAPHNQMPFTVGDRNALLASVDAAKLAQLKDRKTKEQIQLSMIETKGMEEIILAKADTGVQKIYADFAAALDSKQLLEPAGKSAYDLYQLLSQKAEIKDLHNIMRRNLSVALQEDAQQAVNAYLAANPDELQRRFEAEEDYNRYPRYIEKAVELLGENHFYYKNLMAKRLYFEGLGLRLTGAKEEAATRDSIYKIALQKQLKALEYQERAPYVLNELGALYILLKEDKKALGHLDRAIEITPDWGLPYVNYSVGLFYLDEIDKAIEYGEKAAERMPDFPRVYSFLAWISANNWQYNDRKSMERKGLELQDDYRYERIQFNTNTQNEQLYRRALELLKKAIIIDSTYAYAYHNLAFISGRLKQPETALKYQLKVIELEPESTQAFFRLGDYYKDLKQYRKGEEAYLKAIALDENNYYAYTNLGDLYGRLGDFDRQIQTLKKAIASGGGWVPCSNVSNAFRGKGQLKEAEEYNIKAAMLAKGYPRYYYDFGVFYWKFHRVEDAEWGFLKALKIKPDYFRAMYDLANLYISTNQFEKAKPWLEKSVESKPYELNSSILLAVINYDLGDLDKASEYSEKAEASGESDLNLLERLGYLYLQGKNFEKAAHYFKKAEKAEPTILWNDWNWCCYYSTKGEPKKAIQAFEKALEKGYRDFNHICTDSDAADMRKEPEFEILMEKYFPGQIYEGKPAAAENMEPVYYRENCLLLADFYESEGENERAKFLREKAAELTTKEE